MSDLHFCTTLGRLIDGWMDSRTDRLTADLCLDGCFIDPEGILGIK